MDLGLAPKLIVREAMSSPVVSIEEESTVFEMAKQMRDKDVGAIIIITNTGKPVGIVTERDIVNRVVSKNGIPKKIKVKDIMSSPLRMIESETTLMETLNLMNRLNIRRLGVKYKEKLVGIINNKDILRIIPTIVEIEKEKSKINTSEISRDPSIVGYCGRCESYSMNLRGIDGEFQCQDCRLET